LCPVLHSFKSLELFDFDLGEYSFIAVDNIIIEHAGLLLLKYGTIGLRSLDSIQLATVLELKDEVTQFFTADEVRKKTISLEGLSESNCAIVFFKQKNL
jgi:hypothetical protein